MDKIGSNILKLDETGSTNNYLSGLLSKKPVKEGTVVWALNQTAGRGEHGAVWVSDAYKNLAVSILLKPFFLAPGNQFSLLKSVALAVKDFISVYTDNVYIKWPNDIYVVSDKIAGILIENKFLGNQFDAAIVGIGVNVNQVHFPNSLPNPVSLKSIVGKSLELSECLRLLCTFLDIRYNMLKKEEFARLDHDYNEILYRKDQKTIFHRSSGQFTAKILGVEENGNLILQMADGVLRTYGYKEISYR